MLLTLHRYIMRQMLATFLMCWAALTALVTLGGGVSNLFKGEGLGALDLAKLFVFFIPPAATIVLPVAAMFSAAITYGRLSADNELTACRAAGINIHRLFWPAFLLGLAVTAATYYSWNYFMPRFFTAAQSLSGIDLARIAANQLRKNRPIAYQDKMLLHADQVVSYQVDPQRPSRSQLRVRGVAIIQMDGSDVMSCGTAITATIQADHSGSMPTIVADLKGVRRYNLKSDDFGATDHQPIGPFELPLPVRDRLGFKDLPTLRDCLRDPTLLRDVATQLSVIREHIICALTYAAVADALKPDATAYKDPVLRLAKPGDSVELRCDAAALKWQDGGVTLRNAVVKRVEAGRNIWYRAGTGDLTVVENPANRQQLFADLALKDVVQTEYPPDQPPPADRPGSSLRKALVTIDGLTIPARVLDKARTYTDARILDPSVSLPIEPKRAADRDKFLKRVEAKMSQIISLINFRAAVAGSGLALVILAAMLGAIFRGSHVLTAFGVSCAPALFVILAIMAGRNIGEQPSATTAGLCVMWAVVVVLCASTLLIGAKGVRR